MSGKEAVRALRERGLQKPRTEFGPALRTIAFALVAFIVGGGGVYGGVKLFTGGGSPSPAPVSGGGSQQVAMIDQGDIQPWTKADDRSCQAAFNAARQGEIRTQEEAMEDGILMPTGGSGSVGPLGAQLRCLANTKPERLCNPEQRQQFVAVVKKYVEVSIFVSAIAEASDFSMDVYMPAIAAASGVKHGEHEYGMEVVKGMTKDVNARMMDSHRKVAKTLRDLVTKGYVREEDFGSFMGFGVPLMIKNMLKGVTPGASICA